MTMDQAIDHLIQTNAFKAVSKNDARLRVLIGRYKKGELKELAKKGLLEQFGYTVTITVKKPIQ